MPAKERVGRNDHGHIAQHSVSEGLSLRGQATSLSVGEAQPFATQLLLEDSVLLSEKVDDGVLVTADPASGCDDEDLPWTDNTCHAPILPGSALEVEIPPDTIDGIEDALADLAQRYKLCVVSDTIVTPGSGLRDLLEGHGLKEYFEGFAFSDEVGHSKPHRAMFEAAAGQLGIAMDRMVHIGDRDHNDVKGSQALGMKAVLFIATRAHDRDRTSADAVCASHAELPGVIDGLAAG